MLFLANENFPLDAVEAVRNCGHDVAWIRIDVPEQAVPQIKLGQSVSLTTSSFADRSFSGRVARISPSTTRPRTPIKSADSFGWTS